jgi:hypothetical protein
MSLEEPESGSKAGEKIEQGTHRIIWSPLQGQEGLADVCGRHPSLRTAGLMTIDVIAYPAPRHVRNQGAEQLTQRAESPAFRQCGSEFTNRMVG